MGTIGKIIKTFFEPKPKKGKGNLRESLNIKFEEKLIDLNFDNVGTYHSGSRTKSK